MRSALNNFARLLCALAFLLLCAGALVTSTGSSLSVPDWPLSYGSLLPPMIGGVVFEHGHRLIAGVVALLTLTLAVWLARREPRAWVRRMGYLAAAAILLQALLGGLTVLLRLPPAISIAHACLAQAVFALLVAIAQATSPWYAATAATTAAAAALAKLWRLGVLAILAVFLQIFWGALLRHTGTGLGLHLAWALVVFFAVMAAAARGASAASPDNGLYAPSLLLGGLIVVQIFLGFAALKARFSPDYASGFSGAAVVTAVHLAMGSLILATAVVWSLRARRYR
ncbi:MAG: COX15/CtaA family protein [Elusimicrobia bacterium]|nr:COX15/CtaA family protein [Elusimicrobiota bacterium]MDE2424956.1 COX15/CtaA family protein [Elusimicrobiota bacterium]